MRSFACAVLLLLACRRSAEGENPIATCGTAPHTRRIPLSCVTLQLRIGRIEPGSGAVSGSLLVSNRCDSAVALIASPIDTGPGAPDAWERSIFSAYARLRVLTGPAGGLADRGYPLNRLPAYVVVPARAEKSFPLHGAADALKQVAQTGAALQFCTFAAPASASHVSTASGFSLDLTRERFAQGAATPCAVTLRDAAELVCAPPFLTRFLH